MHYASRAGPNSHQRSLFLNCADAKPDACSFLNGQYLVEKPLSYSKETFMGAQTKR